MFYVSLPRNPAFCKVYSSAISWSYILAAIVIALKIIPKFQTEFKQHQSLQNLLSLFFHIYIYIIHIYIIHSILPGLLIHFVLVSFPFCRFISAPVLSFHLSPKPYRRESLWPPEHHEICKFSDSPQNSRDIWGVPWVLCQMAVYQGLCILKLDKKN